MHQNPTGYPPENSGIPLKAENMTNFSRGFNNVGLPIPSGDPSAHSRRIDVQQNMLLAHNSNVGMTQGTNGVSVKTEANYLGNSRFMYGPDGNIMETRPAIGTASVSSFSGLESDPHQLNGTLLNDNSLFGLLGPMSQNFGLSDSTADFTNSSGTSSILSPFLHIAGRGIGKLICLYMVSENVVKVVPSLFLMHTTPTSLFLED